MTELNKEDFSACLELLDSRYKGLFVPTKRHSTKIEFQSENKLDYTKVMGKKHSQSMLYTNPEL